MLTLYCHILYMQGIIHYMTVHVSSILLVDSTCRHTSSPLPQWIGPLAAVEWIHYSFSVWWTSTQDAAHSYRSLTIVWKHWLMYIHTLLSMLLFTQSVHTTESRKQRAVCTPASLCFWMKAVKNCPKSLRSSMRSAISFSMTFLSDKRWLDSSDSRAGMKEEASLKRSSEPLIFLINILWYALSHLGHLHTTQKNKHI